MREAAGDEDIWRVALSSDENPAIASRSSGCAAHFDVDARRRLADGYDG